MTTLLILILLARPILKLAAAAAAYLITFPTVLLGWSIFALFRWMRRSLGVRRA